MNRWVLAALLLSHCLSASSEQRADYWSQELSVHLDIVAYGADGSIKLIRRGQQLDEVLGVLPKEFEDITQVFTTDKLLVVIGRDQFSDLFASFELRSLERIDYLRGRQMSVSPNLRFVVFEKYFPPRGMQAYQSHLTLLYDLTKTPLENRIKTGSSKEDMPATLVGLPLYPAEYVSRQLYMLESTGDQERYPSLLARDAGYIWSGDSGVVLFAIGSGDATRIVAVSVGEKKLLKEVELAQVVRDSGVSMPIGNVYAIEFEDGRVRTKVTTRDVSTVGILDFRIRE